MQTVSNFFLRPVSRESYIRATGKQTVKKTRMSRRKRVETVVALASKMRQGPEPRGVSVTSTNKLPGTYPTSPSAKQPRAHPTSARRWTEGARVAGKATPRSQHGGGRGRGKLLFHPRGPAHRFAPTPGLNFPPVMEEPGLQVLIPPPSEGASDLPANNRNQPFYKLNFHLLCPLISGRVPGSLVGAVVVLREATRVYRWLFSGMVRKAFLLEFQLPRM